jgi:hypothetical protein
LIFNTSNIHPVFQNVKKKIGAKNNSLRQFFVGSYLIIIFVPSGLERSGDLTGSTCQFTPCRLRTDRTEGMAIHAERCEASLSSP